ncbi:unnamed protein product [Protopolystoma xenopodis]|uniref:Uncharacterized protein n=1 Tax=Protopolystoma xenopodis TaxID=117903 RepID=A0A448XCR9_9PLAT|nr:unnamed protein product [Protopolystoma xenopodis]
MRLSLRRLAGVAWVGGAIGCRSAVVNMNPQKEHIAVLAIDGVVRDDRDLIQVPIQVEQHRALKVRHPVHLCGHHLNKALLLHSWLVTEMPVRFRSVISHTSLASSSSVRADKLKRRTYNSCQVGRHPKREAVLLQVGVKFVRQDEERLCLIRTDANQKETSLFTNVSSSRVEKKKRQQKYPSPTQSYVSHPGLTSTRKESEEAQ